MAELKCPHCGQAFTVDDTELSSIVSQIRDKEFNNDVNSRVLEIETAMEEKLSKMNLADILHDLHNLL